MIKLSCDLCEYELADVRVTIAEDIFEGRCLRHGRRRVRRGGKPAIPRPTATVTPLRPVGLARSTDPETSQEAAESINPRGQQERIVRTLIHLVTANRYEISEASGLTEYQAGRRLSELSDAGYIAWTGEVRPGATGRPQSVWRVTQAGYRWLLGPEGLL